MVSARERELSWEAALVTAPAPAQEVSFEQLAIRLAAIGELAAAVNAALNLPAILAAVRRHARWVVDFVSCTLVIADDHEPVYQVLGATGPGATGLTIHARATGWAGWALDHGQTIVTPADCDPVRFRQDQDAGVLGSAAVTAVYLPIEHEGQTVAVLVFGSNRARAFDTASLPIVQLIRLQVTAAICNTRLMERLETARRS